MENVIVRSPRTYTSNNKTPITHGLQLFTYKKPLSPSDKGLLHKAVKQSRPQSENYEDSWGYIIQATRNGGFRWYDSQNKALLFLGRKSESDPRLVIPTFFAEPEYLAQVVDLLQNKLHTSLTILKNVNTEDVKKFLPYGFHPYAEDDYWDAFARFDDQTYPQLIINLESLANHTGGYYKNLRNTLHKNVELTIRSYTSDDKDNVLNLIASKDGIAGETPDRTKGIYYASHAMYTTADIDKYIISHKMTGEILGFTATSDISPKITAFVASIFKPGLKVASVWGIYHTLLIKYHDKFQFANLGGNETEGAYNFMRRTFHPCRKVSKTHLVFDPQ